MDLKTVYSAMESTMEVIEGRETKPFGLCRLSGPPGPWGTRIPSTVLPAWKAREFDQHTVSRVAAETSKHGMGCRLWDCCVKRR